MNKLTGAMYITSQGLTFMQAGEEFARTKKVMKIAINRLQA